MIYFIVSLVRSHQDTKLRPYLRIPLQLRIQLLHILLDNIAQLRTPLNARRPTAHNSKVKQHFLHLLRCRGKASHLKAAQQPIPNLLRISHILQKVRMLFHPLGPKSLRIAPNGNNQLIPPHLKHLPLRLLALQIPHSPLARQRNALQRVFHRFLNTQSSLLEVYAICPALEELRSLLLAFAGARRF